MSRPGLRGLAAALWLVAAPAAADILLNGHQHMGNNDGRCEFTPDDPVTQNQARDYPSHFFLSQDATITGVRLDKALGLDNNLEVRIDGIVRTSTCAACSSCNLPGTITCGGNNSCGDVVIDLAPDIVLPAGLHTISIRDANNSGNDFGFSSITLLSPQTSTAVMLNQRRHPGIPGDSTDTDSNDNYDITGGSTPYFYPDLPEGQPLTIPFTLGQNRRISELTFYRAREVDNVAPNEARVLIDGQFVGTIAQTGTSAATRSIATNFLALAGAHSLRVELGVISGSNVDSFSWDDIVITTVDVAPSGALGSFNATDVGANPLSGTIQTRISNKGFDLDLHAINSLGTGVNTAYAGTVTVELLNAVDNSGAFDIYGCRSSWTAVHTLGSVTFGGGDNGKKKISNVSYPNALRVARVRVTDTANGGRGCSTDALAVRPKEFQAVANDDNETAPGLTRALPTGGYNSNSTPVHKAGRAFTVRVTPLAEGGGTVTGYDGQPTLSAIQLELGTVLGSVATGPWVASGGVLRSDTVTYSEVGAVRLRVEDTGFANIDLADTSASDRSIKKDDFKVGRFIPDHFRVTKAQLTPGCGSFSYVGQSVGFPGGTAVTLTAESGTNTTTLGYTGALFRLPATIAQGTFNIYDDPGIAGSPAISYAGGAHAVGEQGPGVGRILLPSITVTRPATPLSPFPAEIGIQLPVFADADGVLPTESPIVLGTNTSGGGVPFAGGASQMRYGRLFLAPGYGSDRLPLPVPLRTEFWDGVGFIPSTGDACTTLQAGNVALPTPVPGAAPAQTVTLAPAGPGPGPWTVTLSAPNIAGQAVMNLDLSVVGPYPWLLDDNTDGNGLFDNNPRATADFGLYNRSQDNRIYQREVYR